MIRAILTVGLLAGLAAGVVDAALQHVTTVPIIIAAEAYEDGAAAPAHDHDAAAPAALGDATMSPQTVDRRRSPMITARKPGLRPTAWSARPRPRPQPWSRASAWRSC